MKEHKLASFILALIVVSLFVGALFAGVQWKHAVLMEVIWLDLPQKRLEPTPENLVPAPKRTNGRIIT